MQQWIRKAGKQDLENLQEFLTRANLGIEGLSEETVECFVLLEDETGVIKGSLGMEIYGDAAMLRSLVVSSGQAQSEILMLLKHMAMLAKEKELTSLYLATNKRVALPFFEMMGFLPIEREELPNGFSQSDHIRQILNVDNSLFLRFFL